MRSLFDRLHRALSALLTTRTPRDAAPRVEHLEDRRLLSATAAAPTGCACPFCGKSDNLSTSAASANYSADSKWPQPNGRGSVVTVTYSYSNLLNGRLGGGMAASTLKSAVQEAFSRWAAVAPLKFVELADAGPAVNTGDYSAAGKPMIRIGHRSIDGPSGTLAEGYYPDLNGLAGDILFDTSENWTTNPAYGKDFLEVATHEIGHTLGLAHSSTAASVMVGTYAGRYRGLGTSFLYADDVAGIRSLYGAGVGSVTPRVSSQGNGPTPNPTGATFILRGSTLYVNGSAGNDTIEWTGGTSPVIRVNGVAWTGSLASVTLVSIDAGAGADTVRLTGTAAAETFALGPTSASMSNATRTVRVYSAETVNVAGGANDTAKLTDSAGSDTLSLKPGSVRFAGPGFVRTLTGIDNVTATASAGYDRATLHGTSADDAFRVSPTRAVVIGTGYRLQADGFDSATGYANGGTDTANLWGSTGADISGGDRTYALIGDVAGTYILKVFGATAAEVQGGAGDTAYVYDNAGYDSFVGTAATATMTNAGWSHLVMNFANVVAVSRKGGFDDAVLYDSPGNDRASLAGTTGAVAYASGKVSVTGFDAVSFVAWSGGLDSKSAAASSMWVTWQGAWS